MRRVLFVTLVWAVCFASFGLLWRFQKQILVKEALEFIGTSGVGVLVASVVPVMIGLSAWLWLRGNGKVDIALIPEIADKRILLRVRHKRGPSAKVMARMMMVVGLQESTRPYEISWLQTTPNDMPAWLFLPSSEGAYGELVLAESGGVTGKEGVDLLAEVALFSVKERLQRYASIGSTIIFSVQVFTEPALASHHHHTYHVDLIKPEGSDPCWAVLQELRIGGKL